MKPTHQIFVPRFNHETHPETGATFTGAHARNGEKIYEGDIVKINKSPAEYIVYWNSAYLHWGLWDIVNGLHEMDEHYKIIGEFNSISEAQEQKGTMDTAILTNTPTQYKKLNIVIVGHGIVGHSDVSGYCK